MRKHSEFSVNFWFVAIVLFLLAILTHAAYSQTAVVVELSQNDAAELKAKSDAKDAAEKAYSEADRRIIRKYNDLSNGADFSKDFRFGVPKATQPNTGAWLSGCSSTWPCVTTNTTWPCVYYYGAPNGGSGSTTIVPNIGGGIGIQFSPTPY